MLKEEIVEDLITYEETINCVRHAFEAHGSEESQMPSKTYIFFEAFNGDFRVMPAYLEELGAAGVKVVNVHPDNPRKYELPSVMAVIVLLDSETGEPISIMGATTITDYRTGAAGAVAAEQLARKDSEKVGMVGTGAQARTQLNCLDELFDLDVVKAYDKYEESRESFLEEMKESVDAEIELTEDIKSAVEDMDIVITTTPSKEPIVKEEWVSEGTHINAIGADAENKQELEISLIEKSKVIVDEWDQAHHSGEISEAVSKGIIGKEDIGGSLGGVMVGKNEGRTSEDEITIFDTTGLAVQDISTAWLIYEKAKENDVGDEVNFLSLDKF